MEALKLVLIIIFIVAVIACLFVSCYVCFYPRDLLVVKSAIKRGKDISDYDVTGRKHEYKIRQILAKHNYTLQNIKTEYEERDVYGVGKAEYADGSNKYFLYFAENWFTTISEDQYKQFKDMIGQTINVCDCEMKWRKNTAEKKES